MSSAQRGDDRSTAVARTDTLEIREGLEESYSDIYTPEAMDALEELAHFNEDRNVLMVSRIHRRTERARNKQRIAFLDPKDLIPRTKIYAQTAPCCFSILQHQ